MDEEINSDSKEFPRKLSNKCSTGTSLFKYFVPTAKDANEVADSVLIYASKVKYLVGHHVPFPTDKGTWKISGDQQHQFYGERATEEARLQPEVTWARVAENCPSFLFPWNGATIRSD